MAADSRLTTIRSNILDRLEEITDQAKPEYWIDGQRVLWADYFQRLQTALNWVDAKIAEGDWEEIPTIGFTEPI
jgi:hypothetical protein